MKKNTIYLICIVVFCLAIVGIILNYNHKQNEEAANGYSLLDRKGESAQSPEWELTKKKVADLLTALKTDPADTKISTEACCYLYKRSTYNR